MSETVDVVFPVRTFAATQMQMGVGEDDLFWFVYDRQASDSPDVAPGQWHKHCGPYGTREQAEWWINGIRETAVTPLHEPAPEAERSDK